MYYAEQNFSAKIIKNFHIMMVLAQFEPIHTNEIASYKKEQKPA